LFVFNAFDLLKTSFTGVDPVFQKNTYYDKIEICYYDIEKGAFFKELVVETEKQKKAHEYRARKNTGHFGKKVIKKHEMIGVILEEDKLVGPQTYEQLPVAYRKWPMQDISDN